jgi:hypothetical protein
MLGEGSGIVPDRGLNILYRVTMNTIMNLTDAGLTRVNYQPGNAQGNANTRLTTDTPTGILAGQVVCAASATAGAVVACTGTDVAATVLVGRPLGIAINNAVGYPYESSSGVASGKCPYLHGSGTVFSTDLYETYQQDGATVEDYTPGAALYCSQNGLLSTQADSVATVDYIVGYVLIAATSTDPFMVVQLAI